MGDVVGWTDYDAYEYKNGQFKNIDFPGADQTQAWAINDNGVIMGWYSVAGGCVCAFALKNGNYVSFSYPGAKATFALGINAAGQAVGGYTFDYDTYHGFVTNPITNADFQLFP